MGIDPQHAQFHIRKPIRRVHLARCNLQPDARARHQVAIHALSGRVQLRIRSAKALAIPEVNPRLVLDLDVDTQVLKQPLGRAYDPVLCFVGQVRIEVKNVVVLHVLSDRTVGLMVPHRLEQAARGQHALIHTEVRQARGNFGVDRVVHGDFEQGFDGQCHAESLRSGPVTEADATTVLSLMCESQRRQIR
ncbi:hypothetical protein AZH11_03805 [Pseudomonas simiae]|nr:hypothetical protein AZH11_03805 [Pseudomonas simiae]